MPKTTQKAARDAAALHQQKAHDDLHDTVEHLRAQLRERDGIIHRFRESKGWQMEMAAAVCEVVKALEPPKLTSYKPTVRGASDVALVANLSDLHVGELIRPAETGGFGAFNYEIATKRMDTLQRNLLAWTEMNRRSYNIPDLHVFGIGDYISGDIHQELLVSNEFPLPGQTARAGLLIANFL